MLGIILDVSKVGKAYIKFGNGAFISSIGSVNIDIPVSRVTFYIVNALTPFLLYLRDIDKLRIKLHNVCNEFVSAFRVYVLVYRK